MEYTEEIAQAFELVKKVVKANERLSDNEKRSIGFDLIMVENDLKGE